MERGQQEDETLTEHPDSKLPAGKGKESQGAKQEGNLRTVSGNDPLSGAESANKTNEEMLLEMSGYWEQDNMDAVEDLAMLPWYMRMSSDISDANSFYYYGERSSAGQPDGTGIACYADNAYYYGEWSNGKREGNGKWVRFYVYYDDDTTSDRAYREHMYAGEWKNDLPDGEGQEHYELDMSKAAKKGALHPECDRNVPQRLLQRRNVPDDVKLGRQSGRVERLCGRGNLEPLRSRFEPQGGTGLPGCGR